MSDVVTIRIGSQDFGFPVMQVRDVLGHQRLTPVPLAPHAIAGMLNLRGRIVTAIDLRTRLGLPRRAAGSEATHVVVESGSELYALVVDSVGDVLHVDEQQVVYRTDAALIVLLDIARLLDILPQRRAAS
jgi:purine-binding chemotaxis protein CheW